MWILLQRDRNWLDLQLATQRDTKIHYFFIYIKLDTKMHYFFIYIKFILISITHLTALPLFCLLAVMVDYTAHQNWYAANTHFEEQPPPLPIHSVHSYNYSLILSQVSNMCLIDLVSWTLWGKDTGSQFPKFLLSPTHMEHESRHSIHGHHKSVTTHTHTYITHTFKKISNQSILHLHVQPFLVQR